MLGHFESIRVILSHFKFSHEITRLRVYLEVHSQDHECVSNFSHRITSVSQSPVTRSWACLKVQSQDHKCVTKSSHKIINVSQNPVTRLRVCLKIQSQDHECVAESSQGHEYISESSHKITSMSRSLATELLNYVTMSSHKTVIFGKWDQRTDIWTHPPTATAYRVFFCEQSDAREHTQTCTHMHKRTRTIWWQERSTHKLVKRSMFSNHGFSVKSKRIVLSYTKLYSVWPN